MNAAPQSRRHLKDMSRTFLSNQNFIEAIFHSPNQIFRPFNIDPLTPTHHVPNSLSPCLSLTSSPCPTSSPPFPFNKKSNVPHCAQTSVRLTLLYSHIFFFFQSFGLLFSWHKISLDRLHCCLLLAYVLVFS